MTPLPTIRQLQYLDAIAEELRFNRAATRCLVTQSTLSAGIKDLERLLGVQLVERTKRKVLLTPLGHEVLVRGRRLIGIAEEISEIVKSASEPLSGPLRFGVIPTIGPFLLPQILPHFRKNYPAMELRVQEGLSADLAARLSRGRLDIVLLAFPYEAPDWEYEIIFKDPFVFAEPGDQESVMKSEILLEQLEKDSRPILLLEDGHCLRDHALSACHLQNIDPGFRATSLQMITQMVANGFGCTLLPEMALKAGLARGSNINLRQISNPTPYREIGLAWRKSSARREDYFLLAKRLQGLFN